MALINPKKYLGFLLLIIIGVFIGLVIFTLFKSQSMLEDVSDIPHTNYNEAPHYIGILRMNLNTSTERPFGVALHNKNLLVSFAGSDRIDEYSEYLILIRSIHPLSNEKASFTGIDIAENKIFIADNYSGNLLILNYQDGKILKDFGFLPDRVTKLNCFGVKYYLNNLYISDNKADKIFVVSLESIPDIKDEYELILGFPENSQNENIKFPAFLNITDDGRLIVTDVGNKSIKAFTCNGRFAHEFDLQNTPPLNAPMGIGFDNLKSKEITALSDSIFDPTGIFEQGRIHVADAFSSRILVFNQFGKYLFSYGEELKEPNGIAIDTIRRLIFVADSELVGIAIYKY